MNITLIWHAVRIARTGEAGDITDIRLESTFDLFLVISQFFSIIFAFN